MIIMINGPFGVGKTSVATILKDKIENSLIFDPEEVGFMLRNIIIEDIKFSEEKTGDFQDIRLWKVLTVDVAALLLKTYKANLIVPMTICNLDYFSYIYEEFKKVDKMVHHFCLLAKKDTISKRLIKRGDKIGSWPFQQIERCLCSFENNNINFKNIIYTDELTEMQICQNILCNIDASCNS